jgi:hypothetical protein
MRRNRRSRCLFSMTLLAVVLSAGFAVHAQTSAPPSSTSTASPTPSLEREFLKNILRDQKVIWTAPFRLHREDAKWMVPSGLGLMALITTDRITGDEIAEFDRQVKPSRIISHAGSTSSYVVGLHSLLLGAQPLALVRARHHLGRSAQVFAQVVKVDQIVRLGSQSLLDLLSNPGRAVTHAVQLAPLAAPSSDQAINEQLPGLCWTTHRGRVPTIHLVRRPHQTQARLPPTQLPPLAPISRCRLICPRRNTYNRQHAAI